jgi:TRAP transporter TAXI family solute receptor
VATISISNYLITHEEVPEEVVYAMTKGMFENLDQLIAAHADGKCITLENAVKGIAVPLHPGAEKYYKQDGDVE